MNVLSYYLFHNKDISLLCIYIFHFRILRILLLAYYFFFSSLVIIPFLINSLLISVIASAVDLIRILALFANSVNACPNFLPILHIFCTSIFAVIYFANFFCYLLSSFSDGLYPCSFLYFFFHCL